MYDHIKNEPMMLRSFLVFSLPPFAVRFGKYAPLGALQGQYGMPSGSVEDEL
jgi:hypothetical protein